MHPDRSRSPRDILAKEPQRPGEDLLDEVYRRFVDSSPFLPVTHFVDHATMGAEALVGLGLGDRVEEWIGHHKPRPYVPPRMGISIESEWTRALGEKGSHGDWIAFFDEALANRPVEEVLSTWVPRFGHGVAAFLFHGLIRTAHAVRALEHADTVARRGELARGLALWAIGVPRATVRMAAPPVVDTEVALEVLRFARAGAASFVDRPDFPNLHLVTGPMAFLMILNHVGPEGRCAAVSGFRRSHARALRAAPMLRPKIEAKPVAALDDAFLEGLADGRDAHPIKLTEAALRAYEATEDDIFLRAIGQVPNLHGLRNLVGAAKALLVPVA